MDVLSIRCMECGHGWTHPTGWSVYEQQAMESCPCPDCGAYTLACGELDPEEARSEAGSPR